MVKPRFKYKTYIDRVITDEKYNILFGEKPGNVYDEINDENEKQMIDQLAEQIVNQQTQINKQETQIDNQETQITNQETQIERLETQISVLNDVVTELNNMEENQQTQIDNQDTLQDRLNESFDVVVDHYKMEIYGTSEEEKPNDESLRIGTTFFETDTKDVYMYTGNDWVILP